MTYVFLSRLTGRSKSIRKTIMQLARDGIEMPQARQAAQRCRGIAVRRPNGEALLKVTHTYMQGKAKRLHVMALAFPCLLCGVSLGCMQEVGADDYYYVLDRQHGLSDNSILQMTQLPDGRLAVRSQKGINIYDGKHFRFVPLPREKAQPIFGYTGQTHLYVDGQDRLWVKDYRQMFCVDLAKGTLLEHPMDALSGVKATHGFPWKNGGRGRIVDLFVDGERNVWIVMDRSANIGDHMSESPSSQRAFSLLNTSSHTEIRLEKSWGTLQDLDKDDKYVYAFFDSGMVVAFSQGKLAYTAFAYSPSEARCYRSTSLTVQTPSGQFYQVRTGYDEIGEHDASIFLHFDPDTRKYSKIFACDYILHTLNMSSDNQALISSQRGYLMFDFMVGDTPSEVRELSLPDGKSLTTGINTVYRDRDGGIWLGTYHDGLIYVSPMLGLFFTMDKLWWQSPWVGIALVVFLVLVCFVVLRLRRRKRNEAKEMVGHDGAVGGEASSDDKESEEPELVRNARSLIERHLPDSEYGVEQLAYDLCMERTGLYKKLTTLTDTSPVAFIRCVRLQRAAELLKEDVLTVNEIAERTGFRSPSYFTKCFKKEYGVLPSEYK